MGSRLDTAALRELPIVCPDRDSTTQFAPFVDVDAKTWMALLDECDRLRAAMRHIIHDSPGTPDSVKAYLVRELEGSWGGPYEQAGLAHDDAFVREHVEKREAQHRAVAAEVRAARYEQALRDLEDVARAALTWAPGNAKIELANRLGAALAAGSGEERDE